MCMNMFACVDCNSLNPFQTEQSSDCSKVQPSDVCFSCVTLSNRSVCFVFICVTAASQEMPQGPVMDLSRVSKRMCNVYLPLSVLSGPASLQVDTRATARLELWKCPRPRVRWNQPWAPAGNMSTVTSSFTPASACLWSWASSLCSWWTR